MSYLRLENVGLRFANPTYIKEDILEVELLREPLVHFMFIGAVIYLLYDTLQVFWLLDLSYATGTYLVFTNKVYVRSKIG